MLRPVCRFNAPANLVQPRNAPAPMLSTLDGINNPFGMLLVEPEMGKYCKLVLFPVLLEMPVRLLHRENAKSGMTVKSPFDGSTMVPFNPEQS
jgi:hypothetical protein